MLCEGTINYSVPCGTGALVRTNRVLVCSECGETFIFNEYGVKDGYHISEWKYCPHCGSEGDKNNE